MTLALKLKRKIHQRFLRNKCDLVGSRLACTFYFKSLYWRYFHIGSYSTRFSEKFTNYNNLISNRVSHFIISLGRHHTLYTTYQRETTAFPFLFFPFQNRLAQQGGHEEWHVTLSYGQFGITFLNDTSTPTNIFHYTFFCRYKVVSNLRRIGSLLNQRRQLFFIIIGTSCFINLDFFMLR